MKKWTASLLLMATLAHGETHPNAADWQAWIQRPLYTREDALYALKLPSGTSDQDRIRAAYVALKRLLVIQNETPLELPFERMQRANAYLDKAYRLARTPTAAPSPLDFPRVVSLTHPSTPVPPWQGLASIIAHPTSEGFVDIDRALTIASELTPAEAREMHHFLMQQKGYQIGWFQPFLARAISISDPMRMFLLWATFFEPIYENKSEDLQFAIQEQIERLKLLRPAKNPFGPVVIMSEDRIRTLRLAQNIFNIIKDRQDAFSYSILARFEYEVRTLSPLGDELAYLARDIHALRMQLFPDYTHSMRELALACLDLFKTR